MADSFNQKEKVVLESSIFRVMLKADISRYYNSLYTHSIPWALHGKQKAKKQRGNALCGNLLDKWVRSLRDGQTLGIPVGPDSSLIISEILGTAIEMDLKNSGVSLKGVRYIDDFTLFFRDKKEAYDALTKLHNILNKYELEINPQKTIIDEAPFIFEPDWVSYIRQYSFREINKKHGIQSQRTDIIDFFSRSFEYDSRYENKNVLLYAIKRFAKVNILKENWGLTESLLLKTIILNGTCIPWVIKIILEYKNKNYPVDNDNLQTAINEIILYHSQYGHDYEITWALWFSYQLNLNIPPEINQFIENNINPIVIIMALFLRDNGLIKDINISNWEKYMTSDNLYDEYWLLAYEANIKGWLSISGNNYLDQDPFYKELKDKNIVFFEEDYTSIEPPSEEYMFKF
ncbi:hypothetical protein RJ53_07070 [Methanocalculus chunghsingensis]|uniref:Reverse transcriptase domain-containing protein n=2 Tax=Methanocalculus chunghsingensis TaxID=156457 RepID=A0A8J8B5P0_9EURY|nr:hypothetical protein [Methanocalculus chunghsingensis]